MIVIVKSNNKTSDGDLDDNDDNSRAFFDMFNICNINLFI